MWNPQEDAWLRDKRNPTASERALSSMDLYIKTEQGSPCRDAEPPSFPSSSSPDGPALCNWISNSLPHLPWPTTSWDDGASFMSRDSRGVSTIDRPEWSPPANSNGRHPGDNIIVAVPRRPLRGDGRSFLHSTPTFFRPRLGNSHAPRTRALLDNCANLCLANTSFVQGCIPDIVIHTDFTTGVDGIGSSRTVGYVLAPIYIDCMSRVGGKLGKIELNLEIHLIDGLPVDLIVGMDAICAYGIDTIISRSMATISVNKCDMAFPIEFRRSKGAHASSDGFPIVCSESITVPPMHESSVRIISGFNSGGDAWLQPAHIKNDNRLWSPMDGGWVAEGLIRAGQTFALFANMSRRPLRLRRGQVLGFSTPCGVRDCFGPTAIKHVPETPRYSDFSCVPKRGSSVNVWALLNHTLPTPAILIDPHNRDPPDSSPAAPFDVSAAYGSNGSPPACVLDVLNAKLEAFSFDGKPGIVDSVRIRIDTDNDRLTAESPRPVGPHKRKIIDDSIDQMLAWDIIEPSDSRVGYPVVLVNQHGKWRFCVDYRNLNLATVGQAYPMTRTDSVFDALHGKRVFSILDAARGYHQLPVAEDDRWKTAFITHRGLFQYKRMPFGLKNAPIQFQCFMDSILGSLRWTAALVYIDDILIFSDDLESHAEHLRTLLTSAIAVGLKFNPSKCHFAYPSLRVLGHQVSTDGLSILEDRAAAIRELAVPTTLKELWHVLGVFGYYRQFIPKFALIAAPLTRLTKGARFHKLPDGTWQPREKSYTNASLDGWGAEQNEAFQSLKDALSSPPTLAFPNFSLPFIVYVDACHDGMAACLHQPFAPASELPLDSQTPHWPRFLTTSTSAVADVSALPCFSFHLDRDHLRRLRTELSTDPIFAPTYASLSAGTPSPDGFELVDGILYWRLPNGDLATCLPDSMLRQVLSAAHDASGHWGFAKTWAFVKRRFFRPGLSSIVRDYVRSCPDCQRVKPLHALRIGQMSPHVLAGKAFQTVSMDIVLGLPGNPGSAGDGHTPISSAVDACMVIVDQFSKAVILRPMLSSASARGCAAVFFNALVSRGFLPSKLITDRDPKFVSEFWNELMRCLRIECKLVSAYHQQADPAERYIQTIQTLLRLYVSNDNWVECLPFVELVMNDTPNSSSGLSPNQLIYIDPPDPIPILNQPPSATVPDVASRLELAKARITLARANLERASAAQKKYYDRRHRSVPLAAGDRVFVLLDHHPIKSLVHGMHKLKDDKWGPFKILEMVGSQAARLDLPPSSKVHPIISTLHLQRFVEDNYGRLCKPPPAAVIDGDDAWAVDYIFGERSVGPRKNPRTEFKVKWVGYPDTEFTWEPEANLRSDLGATAQSLIDDFRARRDAAVRVASAMTPSGHSAPQADRPIYFISRVLKSYEENYTILELEMAAVVWAILKFQRYLDGSTFTVVTDHQSLLSITGSSSNTLYSARVDKWRMLLAPYLGQMTLVHRAGRIHGNADGLSRSRRKPGGD